jgi:phosphoheptose isomerase
MKLKTLSDTEYNVLKALKMVKDKDNRYILVKPKDTTQLKSLKELNCTIAEKE